MEEKETKRDLPSLQWFPGRLKVFVDSTSNYAA